jgi:hypothetical protein
MHIRHERTNGINLPVTVQRAENKLVLPSDKRIPIFVIHPLSQKEIPLSLSRGPDFEVREAAEFQ